METRLWMGTVASCLVSLRPAWEDDAQLNEALRQRAPTLDDRSLSPLLDIFDGLSFPSGCGARRLASEGPLEAALTGKHLHAAEVVGLGRAHG